MGISFAFGIFLGAQTQAENPLAPYIPKGMKPYFLEILMSSDKPGMAIPDEQREQWMKKHLTYIRSQVEAGKFMLTGPLTDETRMRGIAVIQASSQEEANRIASNDPLVQAGHLVVEVHPILLEDLSAVRIEYPEKSEIDMLHWVANQRIPILI